ncbi:MAG TPA: hypothetical protein PLW97_05180 [Synergistaceae bacterium]|nr:hypothetical protein [Synergistaceae bacterium]HPQ37021.1 hypothetical protein [Synergistaceae bacterium]
MLIFQKMRWLLLGFFLFCLACSPEMLFAADSPDKSVSLSGDVSEDVVIAAVAEDAAEEAFRRGERYFDGVGVSQDYEEAARWYLAAAELGHGIAQYGIATLYERGLGVPEDFEQAVFWYRKAAASGSPASPKAQAALGVAHQMGMGVSRDLTLAAQWFEKAASQDFTARAHLGECYYNGWGVERNVNRAYELLKEAAASDDLYAQGLLFRIDPQKFEEYGKAYPVFRKLKAKRRAFLAYRVVLNTKDSGYGSLRFALATISDGGTIVFSTGLAGKTIVLESPVVIEKDVTIAGPGGGTSISGNRACRVFSILPNVVVTLENLHVAEGKATETGGGILNEGTLILNDCVISESEAAHGGGIWNNNVLAMTHCTIADNLASGDEGSCGGGIGNRKGGTLTLTNCLVEGNRANIGGGIGNGGILSMGNSVFQNNRALEPEGLGGAIRNTQVLSLKNCTFRNNRALSGAALENAFAATAMLENLTVSGNEAFENGGGLANSEGFLILNASTVTLNRAPRGGGLFSGSGGTTRVKNTILADNRTEPEESPLALLRDVEGSFRSLGYNLFGVLPEEYGVLLSETDIAGTFEKPLSAGLAPLDDGSCSVFAGAFSRGRPIPSHIPLSDSPGVDRIPFSDTGCNEAPDTDQCGVRRPLPPGGCGDVGARERIPGFHETLSAEPPLSQKTSEDLPPLAVSVEDAEEIPLPEDPRRESSISGEALPEEKAL